MADKVDPHPFLAQLGEVFSGPDHLNSLLQFLAKRYQLRLFRKAMGILHDDDLAETAVSDTWRHIARYPNIQGKILRFLLDENLNLDGLGNYLVSIVKGRANNLYNELKNSQEKKLNIVFVHYDDPNIKQNVEQIADTALTPEERAIIKENGDMIEEFLQMYEENINVRALSLHLEEWSYEEIAVEMKITVENARQRIQRARKIYANWLKAREEVRV